MIYTSQPKIWGKTTIIFDIPGIMELHRIEILKGGYSSKHRHNTKYNAFYCESGNVSIVSYESGKQVIITLAKGMITTVKNGVTHKFHANEKSVVYEMYYSPLMSDDIERDDTGGIDK